MQADRSRTLPVSPYRLKGCKQVYDYFESIGLKMQYFYDWR